MTTSVSSETDLTFKTTESGDLAATLYRPAGKTVAAIVDVHGGAWTSGARANNAATARHLASNGIAVLSIDFRMPPDGTYPTTVSDVAAAVRWLKAHAADAGTDAQHVGILGTSSGGHMALLVALRPRDERYAGTPAAGESGVSVPFAVACWPVSDPVARYAMTREQGKAKMTAAHDAFFGTENAMKDASPFDIVTRGDAQELPPLLIVQGTNDDNLTPDMQQRFAAAYRAKGGNVELEIYAGEVHGFIARDPASPGSRAALDRITAFVKREADAV
jgi:acetyl esterase